jgi:homoserine acetyltransferase
MKRLVVLALFWSVPAFAQAGSSTFPQPQPHDFTERDFQFKTGDHMDTRIHYYTLGSPVKGADGRVGNAVLILHGTGGSGTSLLGPTFAGMLFCSGCLLDATKYFIISPDNLGHGSSSKPSNGMRMAFPHYDYDDMVALQHKLLTEGLNVEYMLLIAGSAPLFSQTQAPTRQAADDTLDQRFSAAVRALDANDVLYQIDSSRDYNPNAKLETIRVPVVAVNSADDFVNPPELGILEREIKRVKRGCVVVLPITDQTRGHGTHTIAAVWGNYLAELLQKSGGLKPGTSWSGLRSLSADQRVCSAAE